MSSNTATNKKVLSVEKNHTCAPQDKVLDVYSNDLCRRIIPCLDVANGRTVKGVKFTQLRDAGDPIELALEYERQGADELVFLDITATQENRKTTIDLVKQVAARLSIPFTVGGGITSLQDVLDLLAAGADKVSVNTAAVARPQLISGIAEAWGSQCCVLAIDARRRLESPSEPDRTGSLPAPEQAGRPRSQENDRNELGCTSAAAASWEVLTHGGRKETGLDALEWAKRAVELGAGEILLTSWDKDGTQSGFDIELCRQFSQALSVPIIASGGAKDADSFIEVFTKGQADAALAASIFHDSIWTVAQLKDKINKAGIPVRIC